VELDNGLGLGLEALVEMPGDDDEIALKLNAGRAVACIGVFDVRDSDEHEAVLFLLVQELRDVVGSDKVPPDRRLIGGAVYVELVPQFWPLWPGVRTCLVTGSVKQFTRRHCVRISGYQLRPSLMVELRQFIERSFNLGLA
jgi:hypothetical protein